MFNGKINYKWQFSIAMLNYQRVSSSNRILLCHLFVGVVPAIFVAVVAALPGLPLVVLDGEGRQEQRSTFLESRIEEFSEETGRRGRKRLGLELDGPRFAAKWGPRSIAKLVNITTITINN